MVMASFTAGRKLRASEIEAMARQIDSLTAPAWTSYTPTWTTTGTAPVVNNGTLAGRYRRAANSDLVIVEFKLSIGSTTTAGTGAWFISVPVNGSANAILNAVGTLYVLDSGTIDRTGLLKFETLSKVSLVASSGGTVTNTNPQTPAVNDVYKGTIIYEPA